MSSILPSDQVPLNDDHPFNPESIRKIWHQDEWYFSVVDIIAESSQRSQEEATEYWRKLRNRLTKEGNQTVTNLDALKLPARDGKLRKTEVVNKTQALRLLQEIPGARTDSIKNWLAEVGSDRLDEDEDPEAGVHHALERARNKYQREGKRESWIVARIESIITRKEFVEALKTAVVTAPPTMYAQATDKLYLNLWERTTAQLRGDLKLTPKQNPRDHFGEYALIYTRLAEKIATDRLGDIEIVPFAIAMEIVGDVAVLIHQQAAATANMLGIDLVTERPLLNG